MNVAHSSRVGLEHHRIEVPFRVTETACASSFVAPWTSRGMPSARRECIVADNGPLPIRVNARTTAETNV